MIVGSSPYLQLKHQFVSQSLHSLCVDGHMGHMMWRPLGCSERQNTLILCCCRHTFLAVVTVIAVMIDDWCYTLQHDSVTTVTTATVH